MTTTTTKKKQKQNKTKKPKTLCILAQIISNTVSPFVRKFFYTDPNISLSVDVSMDTTIFLNTRWVTGDDNWKHC